MSIGRDEPARGERNLWEALPQMGSARKWAAAAAVGGRLYVCGGLGAQDDALSSAERFDPEDFGLDAGGEGRVDATWDQPNGKVRGVTLLMVASVHGHEPMRLPWWLPDPAVP